ncbi:alginate export family protein [Saccharicrinis sp. FJH2]|uniref:alginate export family protein n=1 Tax=Saccharicrinis sp. FJH65 TaxID=3344659 RepID=UPI0035F471CE
MKQFLRLRSLIILVLMTCSFYVKAQITFEAQFRNRFEIRDGYTIPSEKNAVPAVMIFQRTRLSFIYDSEVLKIKISPQDVRLWGSETMRSLTGLFGDEASLELFEGYAELKLGELGWLSAGRQQLVYDNQRILAARNWNNNGISYDALLLKFNPKNYAIHIGSTWNSLNESLIDNLYPSNRIKTLNFLWVNRKFDNELNLSLLHVSSGNTETDTTNTLNLRHTTGIYSSYKNGNLIFVGDAYYQYGRNASGTKVRAYLISADLSYDLLGFTPGIGATIISGNHHTGSSQITDHIFDFLYGARHRFYGNMDYFKNLTSHTAQGGLSDYYASLNLKAIGKVTILNTCHYFRLTETNELTPDNKNLGFENDLVVKCKFQKWGTLEGGYLFYIPTQTINTIRGVTDSRFNQFIYMQLTIII